MEGEGVGGGGVGDGKDRWRGCRIVGAGGELP
jgi:hypothetical protein